VIVEISEKEFAVIREISNNHLPDQRTIATKTGISLGLTNLIIKRLITKGYVKSKQLNRKKIQYILTPKGFSEKAKKSYNFTLKTIGFVKILREKICELMAAEIKNGAKEIVLSGNSELIDMAEQAIKNLNSGLVKYSRINSDSASQNTVIMVMDSTGKSHAVDIVGYLVDSGLFYWQ
jgi:DNA-binding MarR family transcriptional regulator